MVAVAWWAVVGALAGFAVAALLSIGVLVLPVVLVLAGVGVWSVRLRTGLLPGLLLGASLVSLWLAFTNRAGPGTVCTTTAASQSCGEHWSPRPFLVVGLVLAAAGAWLSLRATRGAASTTGAHDHVPRRV